MTIDDEMLCLADTKLVLGNWFAECVMNGRSLPDFAAMLGMCTASYGQTRAIYQLLAAGQEAYERLERGRGAGEIRSMEMLDQPPQNWEDFIVSIWLAEQATWSMASGFLEHPRRPVAAIARRIGEEAYFHLKYALGWMRVFQGDADSTAKVSDAVARRLAHALDWFGPDGTDELAASGERHRPVADLALGFRRGVEAGLAPLGVMPEIAKVASYGDWNPAMRRRTALPASLFDIIRFKDPEFAH